MPAERIGYTRKEKRQDVFSQAQQSIHKIGKEVFRMYNKRSTGKSNGIQHETLFIHPPLHDAVHFRCRRLYGLRKRKS